MPPDNHGVWWYKNMFILNHEDFSGFQTTSSSLHITGCRNSPLHFQDGERLFTFAGRHPITQQWTLWSGKVDNFGSFWSIETLALWFALFLRPRAVIHASFKEMKAFMPRLSVRLCILGLFCFICSFVHLFGCRSIYLYMYLPNHSMYGIFSYIWCFFNGKCSRLMHILSIWELHTGPQFLHHTNLIVYIRNGMK